jgi:hypothetical protein
MMATLVSFGSVPSFALALSAMKPAKAWPY